MATEAQVAANRLNGLKGGVKTEEGKAVSSQNARKFGIFASMTTSWDTEELKGILERMVAEFQPVGLIEELLVEKLAVTYLRQQRCAMVEATYYDEVRAYPDSYVKRPPEEMEPWINPDRFEEMVKAIAGYDARLTGHFFKALKELERLQRIRKKEDGDCRLQIEERRLQNGTAEHENENRTQTVEASAQVSGVGCQAEECRVQREKCKMKNETAEQTTPDEKRTHQMAGDSVQVSGKSENRTQSPESPTADIAPIRPMSPIAPIATTQENENRTQTVITRCDPTVPGSDT